MFEELETEVEMGRTAPEFRSFVADQLRQQNKRLDHIEPKVEEVHEILLSARGFFKVCNAIGRAAGWIASIAGAAVALYHIFFSNPSPPSAP